MTHDRKIIKLKSLHFFVLFNGLRFPFSSGVLLQFTFLLGYSRLLYYAIQLPLPGDFFKIESECCFCIGFSCWLVTLQSCLKSTTSNLGRNSPSGIFIFHNKNISKWHFSLVVERYYYYIIFYIYAFHFQHLEFDPICVWIYGVLWLDSGMYVCYVLFVHMKRVKIHRWGIREK